MQRLNKQVLNGFVQQAVSHNKFLEEQEMWKKKKKLKKRKSHKREKSPSPSDDEEFKQEKKPNRTPDEIDDLKAILALYKSAKEATTEKWGHSGFEELYPDQKPGTSGTKKISLDEKLEKINEENIKKYKSEVSDYDTTKKKKKKKKSKKRKYKSSDDEKDSDSSRKTSDDSSDESSLDKKNLYSSKSVK